jgi:hypothetical protein
VQEICPLRSTWRGLESTRGRPVLRPSSPRTAPVLDPTYSACARSKRVDDRRLVRVAVSSMNRGLRSRPAGGDCPSPLLPNGRYRPSLTAEKCRSGSVLALWIRDR